MQREKKIREGRLFLSLTKDFLSQAPSCIDDLTKIPVHVEQKSGKAQHGLGKVSAPSSPPVFVGRLFLRPAALQSAGK